MKLSLRKLFGIAKLNTIGIRVASNSELNRVDNQGVQIEEPGPPKPDQQTQRASKNSSKIDDLDFEEDMDQSKVNPQRNRYPFCIVWTPIPLLTWFFPFIGHMGICTSTGIIRDFAGPYFVGQNQMAFGKPTRFLKLDPSEAEGGVTGWDLGVAEASEIYSHRIHNLFCDNCHSHVAKALNIMKYNGKNNWNMFVICFMVFFKAKFVGVSGFVKTFLPWVVIFTLIILLIAFSTKYSY